MLEMYVMFVMHELHPSRVQVQFWLGEVDLTNNDNGNVLRPETEYYIVCAKLLGGRQFCQFFIDLRKLVCRIVDPEKSNTLDSPQRG